MILCIFVPDEQMTYRYMDDLYLMLAHSFSSEHIHMSLSNFIDLFTYCQRFSWFILHRLSLLHSLLSFPRSKIGVNQYIKESNSVFVSFQTLFVLNMLTLFEKIISPIALHSVLARTWTWKLLASANSFRV